jgi:hypothetical protein
MTALGRNRTFEAPLTASDRAKLVSYHRTQLARFEPVHDAAPRQKAPQHIHIHLPPDWGNTQAAAPRQRTHDQGSGSTGGLPLARKGQNIEPPESAGFEDQDPVGSRFDARRSIHRW